MADPTPGTTINALSAQSRAEVGVDIGAERLKPIDPQLLHDVDFVVTLGREAHVDPLRGPIS